MTNVYQSLEDHFCNILFYGSTFALITLIQQEHETLGEFSSICGVGGGVVDLTKHACMNA